MIQIDGIDSRQPKNIADSTESKKSKNIRHEREQSSAEAKRNSLPRDDTINGIGAEPSGIHFREGDTLKWNKNFIAQICASFQSAACAHLLDKTRKFFAHFGDKFEYFGVVGGASANLTLRTHIESLCKEFGKTPLYAPLEFCSDNAAMMGRLGIEAYKHALKNAPKNTNANSFDPLSDAIYPKSLEEDFIKGDFIS
nr:MULTISPECIES: hypothetical protein [unclassified Helicobacter]